MTDSPPAAFSRDQTAASDCFAAPSASATPIWCVEEGQQAAATGTFDEVQSRWLDAARFTGGAKKVALLPRADGSLAGVAFGLGKQGSGEPSGPSDLLLGALPASLGSGDYRLAGFTGSPDIAGIAWGLGSYHYRRYKATANGDRARLAMPERADAGAVLNTVEAIWLGRDLINTPASDMGPEELEAAARALALRHGAQVTSIVGDDLVVQNFPMIHAVGRASSRAPRLIDLRWGRDGAPKVTLVGKGICFDTGGLDIKPASGMLLMKKDMGGAATALALGHMIMGQKLDVALRILIPAAENSISGNAFRPSDVLMSRKGMTVEIGNTDAEGRLVLADAIALADTESPETMLVFATLTGAARTALGPELPAMFTDDDAFAALMTATGARLGDPVWRLPFWTGYERYIDSDIADINNAGDTPFAGAITAALFLKRFVSQARRFAHFDIYGWRPQARALGPKGGEPQTARALFEVLKREYGQGASA